ncbi:MAG: hypothetical protein IPN98_03645 [Propionivibrio sp.]|nr:hypothetical protein [Propionivibrio sp.]
MNRFDARYSNDAIGASACPPVLLRKVVLFAFSQGIVSSLGTETAPLFKDVLLVLSSLSDS